jgi:protein-S-isoprenylcysteine O-methyltransferase Ste14
VSGPFWAIILVVAASYFVYAAFQEEALMLQEFPGEYASYRSRTKMLIPFIV